MPAGNGARFCAEAEAAEAAKNATEAGADNATAANKTTTPPSKPKMKTIQVPKEVRHGAAAWSVLIVLPS